MNMFDLRRRAFTPECDSYYDECESLGLLHKRGMLPSLEDRTKKKERELLFRTLLDETDSVKKKQLWAEIDKRLLKTH